MCCLIQRGLLELRKALTTERVAGGRGSRVWAGGTRGAAGLALASLLLTSSLGPAVGTGGALTFGGIVGSIVVHVLEIGGDRQGGDGSHGLRQSGRGSGEQGVLAGAFRRAWAFAVTALLGFRLAARVLFTLGLRRLWLGLRLRGRSLRLLLPRSLIVFVSSARRAGVGGQSSQS